MTAVSDQQLVERVQQGDKRAFDMLVIKYQHKVAALVSRFIYDHAEVQDVTQEAFIKAYRALPNFRGESQFYTWLYRIAVNTAKNYLVSRGRRPPSTDVDVEDAMYFEGNSQLKDLENPQNKLSSEELMEKVNQSIKKLPEDLRVALTLREYDGMSYEEIADVMGCPVGTVRSRIFRARETVEQAIQPLLDHTEVA
jgi:RNA polymerase sigma-70 factor (ECF subfamily)